MQLYTVFATKRSGHHGIISWITAQHGNITFLNNVTVSADQTAFVPHRSDRNMVIGKGKDQLVNFEINNGDDCWGIQTSPWVDCVPMRTASRVYPILVIRRFRNWLASLVVHASAIPTASHVAVYTQHLDAIRKQTLPLPGFVVIRYDDWFSNRNYRRAIAAKLNIPFTDAGLNTVLRYGGGSTFDGKNYDGDAQHMNVLNRWKQVRDDPRFALPFKQYHALDKASEAFFNQAPQL